MSTQPGRKKNRFLAPQEKYEIWMQIVRGETTVTEAVALERWEAAERETRLALASLDGIGAERMHARCRRLLDRLDPHLGTRSRQDQRTATQVEALRLAPAGLSDQEIATELVLSAHTVHHHVVNIYTRLGCSSRAAAASAGPLGPL